MTCSQEGGTSYLANDKPSEDVETLKVADGVYYYPGQMFDSNVFVISSQGELLVIDTGTGLFHNTLKRQMERDGLDMKKVAKVVLTHVHIDHSGGLSKIVEESSPEVYVFHSEAESIEKGGELTLSDMFGLPFTPTKVHVRLKDGDIIEIGDFSLKIINTPGHTAGSICLYEPQRKMLFSGDTVFTGGSFGRVDFPTGDPQQLISSLRKLSALNVTYLLPGHLDIETKRGREQIALSLKYAELTLGSL
ncbi:MAG: MBL fold metallo-hydrolase [Candidatus Jordarchaeales archaeon]